VSKNSDSSLLGTLVMTSSFPMISYFCCKWSTTNKTGGFILFRWGIFKKLKTCGINLCPESWYGILFLRKLSCPYTHYTQILYLKDYFCFRQDSATSTIATKSEADFLIAWITSPGDTFWAKLTTQNTLSQFQTCLINIWDEMPQQMVRAACMPLKNRCRPVVKARDERL
jgi:hypothetical protein